MNYNSAKLLHNQQHHLIVWANFGINPLWGVFLLGEILSEQNRTSDLP